MGLQLTLGMILLVLTVFIHAVALDRLMVYVRLYRPQVRSVFHYRGKEFLLACTVLGIFGAHVLEIWVWAIAYLFINELHSLEAALYFSTTTFTTVGYGDIVLSEQWRLFSSVESANGFLLFGWSTAFIFEVMRIVWEPVPHATPQPNTTHS